MGHRSLRGDGSFFDTLAGQAPELSITSEQSITLQEDYSEPQGAILTMDLHHEGPDGGEHRDMQPLASLLDFPGSLSWEVLLGDAEAKGHCQVGVQCKNNCAMDVKSI